MRKLAFGYSTKCNIRCEHCVATEDLSADKKMYSDRAREIIVEMAQAGVGGISFFPNRSSIPAVRRLSNAGRF